MKRVTLFFLQIDSANGVIMVPAKINKNISAMLFIGVQIYRHCNRMQKLLCQKNVNLYATFQKNGSPVIYNILR